MLSRKTILLISLFLLCLLVSVNFIDAHNDDDDDDDDDDKKKANSNASSKAKYLPANVQIEHSVFCRKYMYITTRQHIIYKINTTRAIVESYGSKDEDGDSCGSKTQARFKSPKGLACDETRGIVYVADSKNHRIKAIDTVTNTVHHVAGNGDNEMKNDRDLKKCGISSPSRIALSSSGKKLYLSCNSNRVSSLSFGSISITNSGISFNGNISTNVATFTKPVEHLALDEKRNHLYCDLPSSGLKFLNLSSTSSSNLINDFPISIPHLSNKGVCGLSYDHDSNNLIIGDNVNNKIFACNTVSRTYTTVANLSSSVSTITFANNQFYVLSSSNTTSIPQNNATSNSTTTSITNPVNGSNSTSTITENSSNSTTSNPENSSNSTTSNPENSSNSTIPESGSNSNTTNPNQNNSNQNTTIVNTVETVTPVSLPCSGNGVLNPDGSCDCFSGFYGTTDCSVPPPYHCLYRTLNDVRHSAPIPILQSNIYEPLTYSSQSLHLLFKSELITYRTTKMGFLNQQPTCNATWTYWIEHIGNCKDVFRMALPMSARYECGLEKKSMPTDLPNSIYWRGRVQATTNDITGQVKGIPIHLRTKSTLKIAIRFPTSVTLNALALYGVSPIGMEAALTSQEIIFPEEGNPILHITFDTFVDDPFQITSFVTKEFPNGYTPTIPLTSNVTCNNNICINHHEISFDLGSTSCQVNSKFIFMAKGECLNSTCGYSESPASFLIVSEDYCAEPITDVDITGTLQSFADASRTQPITSLITGNSLYLRATLEGATVQTASVDSIFITSPGSSNPIEFYKAGDPNSILDNVNFDNYNVVTKSLDFDFGINENLFPVIGSPSYYSVSVVLAVTFQDATKKTFNLEIMNGMLKDSESGNVAISNNQTLIAETKHMMEAFSNKNSEMQLTLRNKFMLFSSENQKELIQVGDNDLKLMFFQTNSAVSNTLSAVNILMLFSVSIFTYMIRLL